jgi:1-deoxy-D-xylulose-5-phosphate reductoisomerase
MRIPILYALSYPDRLKSDLPRLQLNDCKSLTFADPDTKKFRNLSLAYDALRKGGNMPCILNAANEMAVSAFLDEKIGFMQIAHIVEHTMEQCQFSPVPDLDLLEETDRNSRETALSFINKLFKKR